MRSQFIDPQTGRRTLTSFSSSDGWDSPFWVPVAGGKLSSYLGGLDWSCLGDNLDCPTNHCIASAGGLICTLVRAIYGGTYHDVIVFNCFTGSVKVLSQDRTLHKDPFVLMGTTVDNRDPFHYYVMMLIREDYVSRSFRLEVFDSRSGRWKVAYGSHSSSTIKSSTGLKVAENDIFYSIYHSSDGTLRALAYHAAEDGWSSGQVPLICNGPVLGSTYLSQVRMATFHGPLAGALGLKYGSCNSAPRELPPWLRWQEPHSISINLGPSA